MKNMNNVDNMNNMNNVNKLNVVIESFACLMNIMIPIIMLNLASLFITTMSMQAISSVMSDYVAKNADLIARQLLALAKMCPQKLSANTLCVLARTGLQYAHHKARNALANRR